jgi:hypothetical protein
VPSFPVSFSASPSCSPIHLRYAFLNKKASSPNIVCSNCVISLGADLGRLHISFWRRINILSSLLIVGNE